MKDSGSIMRCMDADNCNLKMVVSMLVSLKKGKGTGRDN